MNQIVFSTYGQSPALLHARNMLQTWGYAFTDDPRQASVLLLPVPSFDPEGNVIGGNALPAVSKDCTIIGGNLQKVPGTKVDLLQDPYYLTENAAITARCALKYAPIGPGTQVLVIGWGRIGKHLVPLLEQAGAMVTAAVRKPADMEALAMQGHMAVYLPDLKPRLYDVVFNTAPASVLFSGECKEEAVLVDLASVKGIFGKGVIYARGLPGKDAPEESGGLIAKTALRYALKKELEA